MKLCNMVFNTLTHTPEGFQTCCFHNQNVIPGQTAEEFWNCDEMRKMRRGLLEGNPVGQCRECIKFTEALKDAPSLPAPSYFFEVPSEGTEEPEYHFEKYITKEMVGEVTECDPVIAIFNISNKCNLACRTCSPFLSDTQAALRRKAGFEVNNRYCTKKVDSFIIETNNYKNLREVVLVGGEPMLDPIFIELLEKLRKDVVVRVQCNGTIYNEKFLDVLIGFKKVIIGFSVDGGKDINEFMRTNVDQEVFWTNVKKTITYGWKVRDDMMFGFTSVLSNVSVFGIRELVDELISRMGYRAWSSGVFFFGYIVVNFPAYFRVTNLDKTNRIRLLRKLQADREYFRKEFRDGRPIPLHDQMTGVISGVVKLLEHFECQDSEWKEFQDFNLKYDKFFNTDTSKIIEVRNVE